MSEQQQLIAQAASTSDIVGQIADLLLAHGLLGAVCIVLGWLCLKFYKAKERLQDERYEREVERVSRYHELATALGGTMEDLLEALERGGRIRARRPRGGPFDVPE